jgi:REP element-mobilizing transposase RayT
VIKNKKCVLHKINGVDDHIHLLISLHPTVTLSNLIKDIKISSNNLISKHNIFPGFEGWQEGYSAFTFSENEKKRLMNYVDKQEEHHKNLSFRDELIGLLQEQNIDYKEEYLP